MNWIKLKRGNDWGVDYFAIEPLRNGTASASRGINLEEGDAGHRCIFERERGGDWRLAAFDGIEFCGTVSI